MDFNNIELKEIKKICSCLEKKRKDEKCFYTKTNNEYIILKFTISFLNFIKCKSNSIIYGDAPAGNGVLYSGRTKSLRDGLPRLRRSVLFFHKGSR